MNDELTYERDQRESFDKQDNSSSKIDNFSYKRFKNAETETKEVAI